jgi:hypothetical protein
MHFDGNAGPAANYEPNSLGGPTADPAYNDRRSGFRATPIATGKSVALITRNRIC